MIADVCVRPVCEQQSSQLQVVVLHRPDEWGSILFRFRLIVSAEDAVFQEDLDDRSILPVHGLAQGPGSDHSVRFMRAPGEE
ncbi:Uu.00g101450.m01.CDS01 [Anthostomella pinea]|uniref:Uu.00g101450.m01.CDS01 n=1 Tax=Anthostomella pinea TaxID=933095 RepID=A0AAI8VE67_9PEZI|nr:Uu.00g101450.m01.CDS01 [Anthostomella pinea]